MNLSKNKILYTNCTHIPLELLSTLGYRVKRFLPENVKEKDNNFLLPTDYCPYSKVLLNYFLEDKKQIVMSTSCDAMRRVYDIVNNNTVLVDVPGQISKLHINYLKNQYQQIIERLDKNNKYAANNLICEIKNYNKLRKLFYNYLISLYNSKHNTLVGLWKGLNFFYDKKYDNLKTYTEKFRKLKYNSQNRPEILLLGSCLLDGTIISLIEKIGLKINCIDSCTGEKITNFQINPEKKDPLFTLAKSYLNNIICPRMMVPERRLSNIRSLYNDRKPQGIIYFIPKFCDQASYDFLYIKKWTEKENIPLLKVEGKYNSGKSGRLLTRINAFKESINLKL
ncbi:MAG: 2-hydroxyacyl-CoA dehydratase [Halanaerobiales bacterium]